MRLIWVLIRRKLSWKSHWNVIFYCSSLVKLTWIAHLIGSYSSIWFLTCTSSWSRCTWIIKNIKETFRRGWFWRSGCGFLLSWWISILNRESFVKICYCLLSPWGNNWRLYNFLFRLNVNWWIWSAKNIYQRYVVSVHRLKWLDWRLSFTRWKELSNQIIILGR